jgi:hypothetical protein
VTAAAEVLTDLRRQRATIDQTITALEQLYPPAVDTRSAIPDVAPPTSRAKPSSRRAKARRLPPVVAEPASSNVGSDYDAKILACLKLAPALGATPMDVAKGVAGKQASERYPTIYAALGSLLKRGLVVKSGRYWSLPPGGDE